ncbi:hypothetical protein ACPPVV_07700 [Rhodanobacter sp. Col0626]|uniref:hypothetical protein n=1 Tax=Rhodanobacter sp. Col0626 TaxID=3415679 RepID=UPI003CEC55B3
MKAQNMIASVAAVLFTTATLGVLNYQPVSTQAPATEINGVHITDLAPVTVTPSAADRRAASQPEINPLGSVNARAGSSLLSATALIGDVAYAAAPMPAMDEEGGATRFSLLGSPLAMPYYSFGKTFGRITKE